MLITLQKLANKISCPSCQNTFSLDAQLLCDIGEEKCKTVCNCQKCGLTMIVQFDDEKLALNDSVNANELNMSCDALTQTCQIKKIA